MPLYFAYGSNMDRRQMTQRVSGAQLLGTGRLRGYGLACDKMGRDGSGKANVLAAPGKQVWGVVWELTHEALARLDGFEGGYRREQIAIRLSEGPTRTCWVYVSDRTDPDLLPNRAYRDRMLRGAREHGLPASWRALLEGLAVCD